MDNDVKKENKMNFTIKDSFYLILLIIGIIATWNQFSVYILIAICSYFFIIKPILYKYSSKNSD